MDARLVLGYSAVGHDIVAALRERTGDLVVATTDEDRVETLRSDGVPATHVDALDAAAIETAVADCSDIDVVAVLGRTPAENRRAARAARQVLPGAYLFAYVGEDADGADREALSSLADYVFDPGEAFLEDVFARADAAGRRIGPLRTVLGTIEGRLAIVTHDNPDPDAIASALALRRIAAAFGLEADVCYYGDISHQENRALINLLGYELRNLAPDEDVAEYGGVALVDHARPGVNDGLPPDTTVDVVIDHHPPRGPVDARYLDLRSDVGATSTLMVDYLRQLDLVPDQAVATGLLFGIRVDTRDFARETSPRDFEAAAYLLRHADMEVLEKVESPSVSAETFRTLAEAIANRQVERGVLTSCVGAVGDRDALAQAADRLLGMEGVQTAVVYGIVDGTVYLSARSRRTGFDLGEALRDAFAQVGDAGGHADMAGAQIDIGMLLDGTEGDETERREIVDAVVRDRLFEVLSTMPGRAPLTVPPETGLYSGSDGD